MAQPIDPITLTPFDYQVIDQTTYELCAVFELADDRTQQAWVDPFWQHPAGQHCFVIEVDQTTDD